VAVRRRAVQETITAAQISERRACRFVGVARATQRYVPRHDDADLRARLETLAMLKPRWGYRRLHWLLTREGWQVNRKRVQRVYRVAGLHVRRRKRVMRPAWCGRAHNGRPSGGRSTSCTMRSARAGSSAR